MFDRQTRDAMNTAVWRACEVFRDVSGDSKDFVLAMLLLKYISDVSQEHLDQNLVPQSASFHTLYAARYQSGNGPRINKALHAIEEANIALRGASQCIDFDAITLGSVEQKDRVLCQFLEAFETDALNFRIYREDAAQAVAAACDSLLNYVAEFTTPPEISQLLARLMQPKSGDTVCDPCCGSGSLLIACSQLARKNPDNMGCSLYGQEVNGRTWAMAKMNMFLHGETQHELAWGNTLRDPKLLNHDGSLKKFDIVVSNPPFSVRDWGHDEAKDDIHRRYSRGVPPRAAADYAFISHMIQTLEPKVGRMAVVVSLGVLFRGAVEGLIRTQLVHENLIDAVIVLPVKMLPRTTIPVAILVLRKHKVDDAVLFIDASRSYQHGKMQNVLLQTDLDLIEKTYLDRRDIDQYARLVPQSEIAANGYNLSVARYIDTTEDEATVDLPVLRAERAQLKAELASLEDRLAILLKEIDHA